MKEYIKYLTESIEKINYDDISQLINLLKTDKNIYIIGNGGSACNASHFAQDLSKCIGLKAMSFDNLSFITAYANDEGYETIYEKQLSLFAKEGDTLIAISGSGNSPNIIYAVKWANKNKLRTIGITGFDGGLLNNIAQYKLNVPLNDMCTVESIHSVIFHYIILSLNEYKKNIR
jgi:D-sedoheptulose 7-phosphate isomerase